MRSAARLAGMPSMQHAESTASSQGFLICCFRWCASVGVIWRNFQSAACQWSLYPAAAAAAARPQPCMMLVIRHYTPASLTLFL